MKNFSEKCEEEIASAVVNLVLLTLITLSQKELEEVTRLTTLWLSVEPATQNSMH